MQNISSEDSMHHTVFTPLAPASSDAQSPQSPQPSADPARNPAHAAPGHALFYTQDEEEELALPFNPGQNDQSDQSDQAEHDDPPSPLVLPFQHSAPLPTIAQARTQGTRAAMGASPPSASGKTSRFSFFSLRLLKLLLMVSVVLITVIGASLLVFAHPASPPVPAQTPAQANRSQGNGASGPSSPTSSSARSTQTPPSPQPPQPTPLPSSQAAATSPAQQATPPVSQTPQTGTAASSPVPSASLLDQLGWTRAGLSVSDAVEALRTAVTFTDREMSYDYRNIGTPARHGGTLTSATFLLTEGGKKRFAQNDVRVINQVLYNKIRAGKIIQQVINPQPALVQFRQVQVQGQQRAIAWVTVAFSLVQAKTDPASGKRTEQVEGDPATGQPVLHHLAVVLIRVAPQNQGVNAPMGGTGWLVNTYALDTATLPPLATTPTL